mgnify:CR=1 FL=1
MSPRATTRAVQVGSVTVGGGRPVVVQSMAATRTSDVEATAAQVALLAAAGAGIVRVAVDSRRDVEALRRIRDRVEANLSVDLQENYRLAADVAPLVEKIRYNPGHLHHAEPDRPWRDKVQWLAEVCQRHGIALRVGVNCGSVDPALSARFPADDPVGAMVAGALEHCAWLDQIGYSRYCVSLKDSDPARVVEANRRFAAQRPDVPLHLGVTEAGLPPEGIAKTEAALGPLLAAGIGDTIRVSLTVPAARKAEEVEAGRRILADVAAGRWSGRLEQAAAAARNEGLNIISCPSCSRVENEAFVELAEQVRALTRFAADVPMTIAVMGCRVNGPGETDDADLGLWCGAGLVHLKRGGQLLGAFRYDEILPRLVAEVESLAAARREGKPADRRPASP